MKNTFGQSVAFTLFGESHGSEIGVVIDGLAPGIKISEERIALDLSRRRPSGKISTSRTEADKFRIVSGVMGGRTTGTPICILIPNEDVRSGDYSRICNLPRPGHADFTAECKYHGYQDYRGGGHFSGRLTAPLVAAGSIALSVLESKGIYIGTHISRLGGITDSTFSSEKDISLLMSKDFPVLDDSVSGKMKAEIENAAKDRDSIGGVLETMVCGMPFGVGEPWFDTVEGILAHALYSVPAVKGVEFGDGFALADMRGSAANDHYEMKDGKVVTKTNHCGGICGGITNGMPIIFRVAIKPTPSIGKEQMTVNLAKMQNEAIRVEGRHDPAIIHRAAPVVTAQTALVICDMLASRFGCDYLAPDTDIGRL